MDGAGYLPGPNKQVNYRFMGDWGGRKYSAFYELPANHPAIAAPENWTLAQTNTLLGYTGGPLTPLVKWTGGFITAQTDPLAITCKDRGIDRGRPGCDLPTLADSVQHCGWTLQEASTAGFSCWHIHGSMHRGCTSTQCSCKVWIVSQQHICSC